MMTNAKVKLGTTTNLLYGYDPSWLSETSGNNALFPVSEKVLNEKDITFPAERGKWESSNLYVSLHDTPESLLDTLLPYRVVNPTDGTKAPVLPSGTLLIGDRDREEAIKKLSETLGVDLGNADYGFALVQLKRTDGEAAHPSCQMGILVHAHPVRIPEEYGVTPEFQKAMGTLKRVKPLGAFSPDDITVEDANACLDVFSNIGTDFVSRVTLGDVIFQVFAMQKERYERIKKYYAENPDMLSGPNAILFRQYTSAYDAQTAIYGYVKEYGKIQSFSRSSVLRDSVQNGNWVENIFAKTDTVFAVFQKNAKVTTTTLNAGYTDVTTIMTDLTSLTLFGEHSRKLLLRRIFKGALIQKYQAAVQPEFVSYCDFDPESLPKTELPGFLSNIATPNINTYKTGLDLSELTFVAPKEVRTFTLYSNYLHNTQQKTIQIPGDDVLICGQLFSLEKEDYTTTIQVNDKAPDTLVFYAKNFYGALLVKNTSENMHFSLVDGLKYISTDGSNSRYYVQVTDDVRNPPDPKYLDRLKSSVQFNYSFSEASIKGAFPFYRF